MTRERKSMPFDKFPRKFQIAINGLAKPRYGRKSHSNSTIRNIIHAFGQYLHVVQVAGLPLELSREGLGTFVDYLDGRGLRHRSRFAYMASIQAVAKEVKYPAAERRIILEDCAWYRDAMKLEVPTKVRKLTANPISLADVGRAAVKAREQAVLATTLSTRRTLFQRSGVLALLSLMPIRIGDVNRLVIGRDIFRRDEQWWLKLVSGKTGYRHNGPLYSSLTCYLDDLIQFGQKSAIDILYSQRVGTPLFATEMGEFLSPRTLAYNFKVATGHTPHIVRTLVHDALAEHGSYGADLARILCGQTSTFVAKAYEVHAERMRAQRSQEVLLGLHKRFIRDDQKAA